MNLVYKYLIAILLVLALVVVLAANLKATTLTISPPGISFIPVIYPDNVAEMSQSEFYIWATNRNKKARSSWWTKYNEAGDKYILGSYRVRAVNSKGSTTGSSITTSYGINNSPGSQYFSSKVKDYLVPTRYLNPKFRHPGPLMLINPYVKPR